MAMIDKILDNVSQAGSYVSVKAKETRTVARIRAEILKAEKEKKDLPENENAPEEETAITQEEGQSE